MDETGDGAQQPPEAPPKQGFFDLLADERFAYLAEFRYFVLRIYGRTAEGVLERAGIPRDIWKDDLESGRTRRILGRRYEKLTPIQERDIRELRLRHGFPDVKRVRSETPVWAAARLLRCIHVALTTAIEDDHNIETVRRLDRSILIYGTNLIDVMQMRAARSYRARESQPAAALQKAENVRTGKVPDGKPRPARATKSYAHIVQELDKERAERRLKKLSEKGVQKYIAKKIGVSESTVTRAKKNAKLDAPTTAGHVSRDTRPVDTAVSRS